MQMYLNIQVQESSEYKEMIYDYLQLVEKNDRMIFLVCLNVIAENQFLHHLPLFCCQ